MTPIFQRGRGVSPKSDHHQQGPFSKFTIDFTQICKVFLIVCHNLMVTTTWQGTKNCTQCGSAAIKSGYHVFLPKNIDCVSCSSSWNNMFDNNEKRACHNATQNPLAKHSDPLETSAHNFSCLMEKLTLWPAAGKLLVFADIF